MSQETPNQHCVEMFYSSAEGYMPRTYQISAVCKYSGLNESERSLLACTYGRRGHIYDESRAVRACVCVCLRSRPGSYGARAYSTHSHVLFAAAGPPATDQPNTAQFVVVVRAHKGPIIDGMGPARAAHWPIT